MYKKMALELHPDKGGDPEKFQELQEMKDRPMHSSVFESIVHRFFGAARR